MHLDHKRPLKTRGASDLEGGRGLELGCQRHEKDLLFVTQLVCL